MNAIVRRTSFSDLNKMTHASLFSGIGGFDYAAALLGWINIFDCEIDSFCRKVLEYHFPNSVHYGDITKQTFKEWRGKIDVLSGGFPCFVAGTPVLTRRGFLPIDEVRIGDEVLTTERSYHPVDCTMRHTADEIIYMRAQGMYEELKCTPNHPFYVRRKRTHYDKGVQKITYDKAEYVNASELAKGDKVGYPIFEGNDTSFTNDFWKLVGTWIADGWIDNGKRSGRKDSRNHKVIICCGKKNISRLHHIIQRTGFKYTLTEEKTVFKCIICDKWLCEFLRDFGKYAHGKHLSPQCFMLDRNRKRSLLEGWFADGYKKSNGAQCVTTVSERLALDMAQIARDVYLCPVSISRKTCKRVCVIEGREVNERPQYCVTISNSEKYGFYEDGFVWCNIKSIRREKELNEVFNLSVNEEHSYNVYGIAVHNCQPFSLAGQRKGADDNRYLWPQMLRVIREIRPTWVVGENVAGILTMVQPGAEVEVGGQASLFGEDYRKRVLHRQEYVIETICRDLEREGYAVQPLLIPACAVGAPHRRDRIWFIAHRTNAGVEAMQFTGQNGIYAVGTSSNADGDRYTSCGTSCRTEKERCERAAVSGQRGGRCEWFNGLDGFSRIAADPYGKRQIYGNDQGPERWEKPDERFKTQYSSSIWEKFPTQSPIRRRDDGLSGRLDGITFSKWRQESVKAYGNAIVPQVAYEIFKAIELCR